MTDLPVDIDSSYLDQSPGDAAHQQHHDKLHELHNKLAGAAPDVAAVPALDAALEAKAPLDSPALTGTPTVPTAPAGTNTTQAASTAFVGTAVDNATSDLSWAPSNWYSIPGQSRGGSPAATLDRLWLTYLPMMRGIGLIGLRNNDAAAAGSEGVLDVCAYDTQPGTDLPGALIATTRITMPTTPANNFIALNVPYRRGAWFGAVLHGFSRQIDVFANIMGQGRQSVDFDASAPSYRYEGITGVPPASLVGASLFAGPGYLFKVRAV